MGFVPDPKTAGENPIGTIDDKSIDVDDQTIKVTLAQSLQKPVRILVLGRGSAC